MDIMKKRWLILIASCLVTLCAGSLYAWSVFATPMANYLSSLTGAQIASLAIVFTVANSVGPITMISGGAINDKIGPRWILIIGGLLFGAFGGMMIISQASPLAQNMMGFTPAAAAAVVSILAFFNMLGRLASGMISDRIGAVNTMKITFTLSAIACVLLFFCKTGTNAIFYVGLSVVGFSFGSIMGIYPGFTARQFGRKNNSVNYGIMFIGFALAGLFGPIIMNTIYSSMGKYQPAFLVSAAVAAVGLCLVFALNSMAKKKADQIVKIFINLNEIRISGPGRYADLYVSQNNRCI